MPLLLVCLCGCAVFEARRVRALPIGTVDLTAVPDGIHPGSFSYAGFTYRVRTRVSGQTIVDIEIDDNRDTLWARRAEGVLPRIVVHQTPAVDAVTGATTTSRALMKAVENSLRAALRPARP